MRRTLLTEDHEAFRGLARDFIAKEVVPAYPQWEKAGRMPRDAFAKLGETGMMGMAIPAEYGGGGQPDYRYNVVLQEEAARALVTLSTVRTQLEVILPYFLHYANAEQRDRWFPGLAAGTLLTAVAMTEPGTGSDLAGVRTTAVRDGGDYVLNGAKTFITGGMQADLVIVVARTSTDPDNRRHGLTLLVVEGGMPGFERGRELEKMGCKVQDTAELSFTEVRVPVANRLGDEGQGFKIAMSSVESGRLTVAARCVGMIRACLVLASDYAKTRETFGQPIGQRQLVQSKFTDMRVAYETARLLVLQAAWKKDNGERARADMSMAKMYASDALMRTAEDAMQIHGAYGCSDEYDIGRYWRDAKFMQTIEGSNEIHRGLIAEYELGYRQ